MKAAQISDGLWGQWIRKKVFLWLASSIYLRGPAQNENGRLSFKIMKNFNTATSEQQTKLGLF